MIGTKQRVRNFIWRYFLFKNSLSLITKVCSSGVIFYYEYRLLILIILCLSNVPPNLNYLQYQNQLLKAEKQVNEAKESLSGAERRRREVETVVASLRDLHGNYDDYYYFNGIMTWIDFMNQPAYFISLEANTQTSTILCYTII